jgi:hypothetical protein
MVMGKLGPGVSSVAAAATLRGASHRLLAVGGLAGSVPASIGCVPTFLSSSAPGSWPGHSITRRLGTYVPGAGERSGTERFATAAPGSVWSFGKVNAAPCCS